MLFGIGCVRTPSGGWSKPRNASQWLTVSSAISYSNTPLLHHSNSGALIFGAIHGKSWQVGRELQLSGGEITILKGIGLTGTAVAGKFLLDRMEEVEAGEFIDTLDGLLAMGYILASKVNIRTLEDVEKASFRVNPSYAHDLKDALDPNRRREQEKQRRRRRG